MRKRTGFSLIVAAALVIVGVIMIGGALSMRGWSFRGFSTSKMQTKDYEITENFDNISIETATADVVFALSEDGKCKVVCYEEERYAHTVGVEGGRLTVEGKNEKKWYDYINFNFSAPKITVYLPEGKYNSLTIDASTSGVYLPKELSLNSIDINVSTGDVECYASADEAIKITTSTGHIDLANVTTGALDLTVSSGKVKVVNVECAGDFNLAVSTGKSQLVGVRCQSLTTAGNTGSIHLDDVLVSEKLSITRSTGDVEFEDLDAGEIFIKTGTGDVEGTLLSEKIFITKTSTGEIDVPRTTSGGICEITTSTGDIEVDIK